MLTRRPPTYSHLTPSMRKQEAGFTYIGLLIMLALIALVAATSIQVGSILQRRAAEEELLAIGREYRLALQSYAKFSQAGQKSYPPNLEALLKDPRYPTPVRHLRKIYTDPLTGNDEWGIAPPLEGNGVLAVYSLATGKPIKVGNFDPIWQGFEDSENYQRWRFGVANLPPLGAKTVGGENQKSLEDNRRELNAINPAQSGDPTLNRERMNQLNQDDAANESRKP